MRRNTHNSGKLATPLDFRKFPVKEEAEGNPRLLIQELRGSCQKSNVVEKYFELVYACSSKTSYMEVPNGKLK